MGRKRLLAMLATTVLLTGASAPAALAQTSVGGEVPDVGSVEITVDEDDDSVEVTAETDTGEDAPVEEAASVEVSPDGVTADTDDGVEAEAGGDDGDSDGSVEASGNRVSGAGSSTSAAPPPPAPQRAGADRLPQGYGAAPPQVTSGTEISNADEAIPAPLVAPPAAPDGEVLAAPEPEPVVRALDAASPISPETVPTLVRILTMLLVAGAAATWRKVTSELGLIRR